MRPLVAAIAFACSVVTVSAQAPTEALAAIGGRTITAQDLEPAVAQAWLGLPDKLRAARTELLEQQIDRKILEMEAAKRETSIEKLVDSEVSANLPAPTEEAIKRVYDENQSQIGGVPIERVRGQIIEYLNREAERKRYEEFIKRLRANYKIAIGKDINSKDLKVSDIIATIDDKAILYLEYVQRNGLALYEMEADVADAVLRSVTQVVDAAVYTSEAESLGIATSDLIAREITDKMKDFSDVEREKLETDLRDRLYKKNRVIIFVKEVTPFIQAVSADDDPYIGRSNAKVTVVMFSDFQCPTCAGVHPVLKKVIGEFGTDVRLVVRDYPLEQIHDNAFNAAVAAEAARKQGKYFEYIELLYDNQDALDSESLASYADQVGLNLGRFQRDLADPELAAEVRKDIADGVNYGVDGTPSIYVNGYKIRTLSAASFRKAIRRALGR
ncbi:MAG: thioredoxin domain-containing protein [Acidobacteriota bacterium]|nr:MAG: thioredoxin domain-containing protein [Acidobacteriota bacterium]